MIPNQVAIDKNPYPEHVLEEFNRDWKGFGGSDMLYSTDPGDTDIYFNSYSYIGIHEEMLKDSVRTGIYYRAIMSSQHLFRDKVVMDVGCGTGILSLFCAKAGARKVYAVDNSSIIGLAQEITEMNGLSDRIVYIRKKVEELDDSIEPVDIIISEWMGYFLLYENMLSSVLFCRDKYLKPGGLLFPDRARIFISAIEDAEYKGEKFDKWDDTYGLDFSIMKNYLMEEAVVDVVDEKAVVTSSFCILDIDLNTCSISDTDFCSNFVLISDRRDYVHAFIFWFEVSFTACSKPLTLTTSPKAKYTHWKQTVLYIDEVLNMDVNDRINGMISVKKNKFNSRDVDIKISYQLNGTDPNQLKSYYYRIR
ncbi:arginine N-methyltransferase [Theileria orientalis]|uniref:type I protein arginine methyltransferase n=1 Tax=Theileria orientalis TaxID=68886 RepID=A0A976QVT3_THEOR|nr:arginine N-methyltransferase [Theileria orientalis]